MLLTPEDTLLLSKNHEKVASTLAAHVTVISSPDCKVLSSGCCIMPSVDTVTVAVEVMVSLSYLTTHLYIPLFSLDFTNSYGDLNIFILLLELESYEVGIVLEFFVP